LLKARQEEQLELFFLFLFWGCPARWAGRAVSQLAVRSALQAFSLSFKSLGSAAFGGPAAHPSAKALCAFSAAKPPVDRRKKGPLPKK